MKWIESWERARRDPDLDVPFAVSLYIGRRSIYALFHLDSQLDPAAIPVPNIEYMPGINIISVNFTTHEPALVGLSGHRVGDDLQLQINSNGHVLGVDIFRANAYFSARQLMKLNRINRRRNLL